jgi:hypothetical protein
MRELNIDFLDLYKKVDKFIKDAYLVSEGVSAYIRMMESNNIKGVRYVDSWQIDYERLKHMRWVRNQLAHEVGYDSDICEESDYDCLNEFYNRLFSSEDPLSILRKQEELEKQRLADERRKKREEAEKNNLSDKKMNNQTQLGVKPVVEKNNYNKSDTIKKPSLWKRIKHYLKDLYNSV